MDFETFGPALPLYAGTHPYETIPFQWSPHVMESAGGLRHHWFLHYDTTDPREALLTSLLEAVGTHGSTVVYSSYEKSVLNQLAQVFPQYTGTLSQLGDWLFDLLPVIRDHVYHPNFNGGFSLKHVLPALVADIDYDSLDIQDGNTASFAFAQIIDPATEEPRRRELRQAWLDYCGQDTLALVRMLQTLRYMSAASPG